MSRLTWFFPVFGPSIETYKALELAYKTHPTPSNQTASCKEDEAAANAGEKGGNSAGAPKSIQEDILCTI